MKDEYDFRCAARGKFFRRGAKVTMPPAPEPVDAVIHKAMVKSGRTGTKIALASVAITAALAVPLWMVEPISGIVFLFAVSPLVGRAVGAWWLRRCERKQAGSRP